MALSKEALQQALNADRALASAMLFPHRHPDLTPAFHIEIVDLWRCADELVCIEGFRGSAKSTLSEEFIALEAAFGNFHYAYLIGETYAKACERLDAIKHELRTNGKLLELFGPQKDKVWNEDTVILQNVTKIQAIGWDQEIRGEKHLSWRPDRAYLDDIENDERVRSRVAVDAGWIKFWKQLRPAMDKHCLKIRITGTPLADDCLITRFKNSPDCLSRSFPICNGDIDDPATVALWPDRYPMDWIRSERDKWQRAGTLREFMQEYMLIAAQTAGKPFTDDMIVTQDLAPNVWLPKKVIIDPARTVDVRKSDETGSCVLSKLGSTIHVHESDTGFLKPDEIVDLAFTLAKRHQGADVIIEKNSLDDWLLQPIRAQMLMRGQTLNLFPVNAPQDKDKISFILGLQPFFKAKEIILIGGVERHAKLIAQIKNFPSGRRDVLNALALGLRAFAGVPVYPEFSELNIVDGWEVQPGEILALAVHCDTHDIACALVAISGQRQIVLADWVSSLNAKDAIADITTLVRAAYPGRRLAAYVPSEIVDQQSRIPLASALRANSVDVIKGPHIDAVRGALSPKIRTELQGHRLLLVDRQAQHTLNALTGGYCYPMKNGAQMGEAPQPGHGCLIGEALETLTAQLQLAQANGALPEGLQLRRNAQGVEYPSALATPRR